MSNIKHSIVVQSPTGNRLDTLYDRSFSSLKYGLKRNEPGVLELSLPHGYNMDYLKIDGLLEVYRSAYNVETLEGDTAWFIRKIITTDREIQVTAYSALCLLGRRVIAYHSGSSYSEKVTLPWDTMVREYVDENMGPGASDTDRDLSPWFSIPDEGSKGDSYSKAASWRNLMDTLLEILDDVQTGGTLGSIDVIRTAPATFEFRVFIGPRGVDHSDTSDRPVVISEQMKNLADAEVEENWESEYNFIYATGQGNGSNKTVETSSDDARIKISPFNRNEFNQQSRNASTTALTLAEADACLEKSRPYRLFTGKITQTRGCIYGLHWNWGDIVTAEKDGYSFNCHVESVTVSVDDSGRESVTGNLRSVTDVDR